MYILENIMYKTSLHISYGRHFLHKILYTKEQILFTSKICLASILTYSLESLITNMNGHLRTPKLFNILPLNTKNLDPNHSLCSRSHLHSYNYNSNSRTGNMALTNWNRMQGNCFLLFNKQPYLQAKQFQQHNSIIN